MTAVALRGTEVAIANVRAVESRMLEQPQERVITHHVLHGGMYHRTVAIKAGTSICGCHVIKPTTITLCGDVTVDSGDGEPLTLSGYHILPAFANRKQAFTAHSDTLLTMSMATKAATVEQAEAEFTDEPEALLSRSGTNHVVITGEG